MSGQGGIAVLVSLAQVILAIISALHPSGVDGDVDDGGQSTLAGVGLWALGALGAFGCMIAHRRLMTNPNYSIIVGPVLARADQGRGMEGEDRMPAQKGLSRSVFRKNRMLEAAVAWVFVVTLVSGSVFA